MKLLINPRAKDICPYCPTILTLKDGQVHEAVTDTPIDKRIVHYRLISTPIKNERGEITAAIEIVEDITKRRRAEEKIKNAANEWRATFDSMPYGVMLLDKDMHIIRANQYISELTGIPIKDLLGKSCYEIIHGKDKPVEGCLIKTLSNTRKTQILDFYETRFNKHFMGYQTFIPDEKGQIKGYIISLVDITESKAKEKTIIESRNVFFNMLKETDLSYKELHELYNSLIRAFVNTLDAKSPWTKGHSERVTQYSISIAKSMGIKEKDIESLRIAALLHDIGKIGI